MRPYDLLTQHFRLVPTQISALKKLGIITIHDLLYHFPSRFSESGASATTRSLTVGSKVTLVGSLSGLIAKKLWKSRRNITEGTFEDGMGRVKVMWFNQPYIKNYVKSDTIVRITGTVGGSPERPYISNPEVEVVPPEMQAEGLFVQLDESGVSEKSAETPSLFPVYVESAGITSRWFYHAMQRLFSNNVHTDLADPLPTDIRERYHLPDLATALVWIHAPEKATHQSAARKRFAFEEIFTIQVARALDRAENDLLVAFAIPEADKNVSTFLSALPYTPTGAQVRSLSDIIKNFENNVPMARLLEGDVGAGKTLVAAAASYAVVKSRPPNRASGTLQVAYMAPTEILATQHFESFIEYFKDLPINIGLITGSGCRKFPSKIKKDDSTKISRAQLLKWVENGEIAMVIGTHALVQKSVVFQNLALAIVDEQHRFGTKQRRALTKKGTVVPHFLSMTATPIPRTLALTMYGDLDISLLDELPKGRAKITTTIVNKSKSKEVYELIREELKKGRQAYIVCPRIEEPDPTKQNAIQATSVKAETKRLQKEVFPEYCVEMLHGAMTPAEKDEVMVAFAKNDIQVLVATSVIEVGINVPNATSIVIEGAERFGLAQLHQLRGRVMRSSNPPQCFLMTESKSAHSLKRLKALEKSDSGFVLAEADLALRGAGDLYGQSQWGVSDLGMEALQNVKLIKAARDEAQGLIARTPDLSPYPTLKEKVRIVREKLHQE